MSQDMSEQNTDQVSANNPSTNQPLFSDYADDPDMLELVEMFVSELPIRMTSIEQAMQQTDLAALAKVSHQLKGAAGGYGFMPITDAAAQVEKLAKVEKDLEEIEDSIAQLLTLCRRATADPK